MALNMTPAQSTATAVATPSAHNRTTRQRVTSRALLTALLLISTTASAQFAPRLTSDDIEGAIMPAIPFPLEDSVARSAASDESGSTAISSPISMPMSLGLVPADQEDGMRPANRSESPTRRRPLSAQETADRLLNR